MYPWIKFTDKRPDIGTTIVMWGVAMPYRVAYVYSDGIAYQGHTDCRNIADIMRAYSHWMYLNQPVEG